MGNFYFGFLERCRNVAARAGIVGKVARESGFDKTSQAASTSKERRTCSVWMLWRIERKRQ